MDSIEIAKVLSKRPANDNGGRPVIIPVFTVLLARHDLTRTDVLVYGALVALHRAGASPTLRQICELAGVSYCEKSDGRHARAIISKLIDRGLMRREYIGGRGKAAIYHLLGPDLPDDARCA